MSTISTDDVEARIASLLDRVEHGEEVVVTRHGVPVVRISPFSVHPGSAEAQRAMDELRERAGRLGMSVTAEDIRTWIDAGRA